MQDKKHIKVAVAVNLTTAAERNFFAGILNRIRLNGTWQIRLLQGPGEFTPSAIREMDADGTDGIITTLLPDDDVNNLLDRSRIPLVIVGSHKTRLPSRQSDLCYLTVDEQTIGRAAARFFISLGVFRSYAFVPHREAVYARLSLARGKGFRDTLAQSGLETKTFDRETDVALADWLESLPRPAALFAADDRCAHRVLALARKRKISIPRHLSVLGVDNDELVCLSTLPHLSSILPGAENEGESAVSELSRLLSRKSRTTNLRDVICTTSNEIVERGSTQSVKPSAHLINSALAYIEAKADRAITTEEVVNHLKVSKRLAELRFHEILGATICQTILRVRLEHLAKRLEISTTSISRICRNSGFSDLSYVMTTFKRHFGKTMGQWRLEHTAALASKSARLVPTDKNS